MQRTRHRHRVKSPNRILPYGFVLMLLFSLPPIASRAQTPTPTPTATPTTSPSRTQVVLLGTGNPSADPDRSGPSVAIVVNDTPYIIDCGPGIVRRASAAFRKGVAGLAVQKLKTPFITHLHSDHTLGHPDII